MMKRSLVLTWVIFVGAAACMPSPARPSALVLVGCLGLVVGVAYWFSKLRCRPWVDVLIAGAIALVVLAAVIPTMARARHLAVRTSCQSHLHQFALALAAHCSTNGSDLYPMALTGLSSNDISPLLFICPGDRDARNAPTVATAGPTASYLYIGGLGPKSRANVPLIICPDINHDGKGGSVLFCSHEVKWIRKREFDELIDWTYAYAESNGLRVVVSDALTKRSKGRYKSRP
ncbi:MAG: hypothetical protein E4H02_12985 [Lentisphaerales bacterium]|jgi:hypothetical protein|nr:MAG: hypothetical protein E4H02_12985 [Lentisphaerales bacterium]